MSSDYILEALRRIEDKVDNTNGDITVLKVGLTRLDVHEVKISNLQKIVYGAVGLILIAFMMQIVPVREHSLNARNAIEQHESKKILETKETKTTKEVIQ